MKSYNASAIINADPVSVMSILTDAPKYPEWNSTIDRIDGRIALGEAITLRAKISPGRAFPLKVSKLVPGQKMVWSGGIPNLFKGVRTFTLAPGADGATVFKMQEDFSGLLLPLIGGSLPDLGPAFQQFALDLKSRAESLVTKSR